MKKPEDTLAYQQALVKAKNPHEWIGVDLDGTLAAYHGWHGMGHIGDPISAMLVRVKRWRAEGRNVRIFTARLSAGLGGDPGINVDEFCVALDEWCLKHVGEVLPVTNIKDFDMIELWDDRAVQVGMNTGECIGYSTRGTDDK